MATLYEVLDDFCRNKKSGKVMPKKNWSKPNTVIHRSVNHDPDETSPEIIKVAYGGKVIMSTYQDGRIVLHGTQYSGKMVRTRINEFLNASDTGWTIGGYYGPWYMCYNGQKVAAFEDGTTIEPAPKKDWSKAEVGDKATCFYCNVEIYVKRIDGGRHFWYVVDPMNSQKSDPSYCVNGWQPGSGHWHLPEFKENGVRGGSRNANMWEEIPDGDYSMGDVSKCQYCKEEITLQAHGREHLAWSSTYGEAWCGRSPTTWHPAGESNWHRPDGTLVRRNGQQQEFPCTEAEAEAEAEASEVQAQHVASHQGRLV